MYAAYIGVLRQSVKEQLNEYYDRPFDIFESYFEMTGIYHIPSDWKQILGNNVKMDWGSWLYVCDRQTINHIIVKDVNGLVPITPANQDETLAKRGKAIPFSQLPVAEQYGILEVELW